MCGQRAAAGGRQGQATLLLGLQASLRCPEPQGEPAQLSAPQTQTHTEKCSHLNCAPACEAGHSPFRNSLQCKCYLLRQNPNKLLKHNRCGQG